MKAAVFPTVIEKPKLSLLVVSVTDVAAIVGEAFAPIGTTAGGKYDALKLGDALAVSVPQPGEQAEPPAVSVQVTPAPALSFETLAFTGTAGVAATIEANLSVMLTPTGGVMVKSNAKDTVGSATDVAVIVADWFRGVLAGGV